MSTEAPNPLVYAIPAVLLVCAVVYFGYGTFDRAALQAWQAEAQVTGKQVTPASTTYSTVVIDGRTMLRSNTNPDQYVLSLLVDGVATGTVVKRNLFESLQTGQRVRVTVRRTRLSKRLLVTDVTP